MRQFHPFSPEVECLDPDISGVDAFLLNRSQAFVRISRSRSTGFSIRCLEMERKDYRYFLPFFFFLQFYSVTTLSLYILIARRYIQSVLTIRNYSGTTGTTMYVFSRATIILYRIIGYQTDSRLVRSNCSLITVIWWRRSMLLIGSFPIPSSDRLSSTEEIRQKTDLGQFLMTARHGLIITSGMAGDKTSATVV